MLASHSSEDPNGLFTRKRLSLSPGNYSVIVPTLNPNDSNSVVNIVFQVRFQLLLFVLVIILQIGNTCVIDSTNCTHSSIKTTALASLLTLQIQVSSCTYTSLCTF